MAVARARVFLMDLDGVIADVSGRLAACRGLRGEGFWDCFFDPRKLTLDRPNIPALVIARGLIKKGVEVLIVTGRPERLRDATLHQLKSWNAMFSGVVFRPEGDRTPAWKWKPRVAREVMSMGFTVVGALDDDPKVVAQLRKIGIPAIHYPPGGLDVGAGLILSKRQPSWGPP